MKFSPYVTDLLRQKSDKDFRQSADCEYLALDIETVTGEHIGVNTLKRLLGFIGDDGISWLSNPSGHKIANREPLGVWL